MAEKMTEIQIHFPPAGMEISKSLMSQTLN